jgi:DNA-binding CsgD family transcriptional regulator
MTRVLIFKEPDAFGVMEVNEPPERIVRGVNQGRWEDYLPDAEGPLFARRQADVVVVTQSKPALEEEAPKLSRREHQVLALLGEGLTTAQIALRLGLSPRTIRGYVAGMKVKMDAHNIQHLVARAVAMGLVKPEI